MKPSNISLSRKIFLGGNRVNQRKSFNRVHQRYAMSATSKIVPVGKRFAPTFIVVALSAERAYILDQVVAFWSFLQNRS